MRVVDHSLHTQVGGHHEALGLHNSQGEHTALGWLSTSNRKDSAGLSSDRGQRRNLNIRIPRFISHTNPTPPDHFDRTRPPHNPSVVASIAPATSMEGFSREGHFARLPQGSFVHVGSLAVPLLTFASGSPIRVGKLEFVPL